MKRPRRVKVGAFWYSIEYSKQVEDRCIGICYHHAKRIRVQSDLSRRMLAQTVLHEIMHAIYYEFGLTNSEQADADNAAGMVHEEAAVNGLSIGMMQVLVDNPGFRRFLVEASR